MAFDDGTQVTVTPRANCRRVILRCDPRGRFLASIPPAMKSSEVRRVLAELLPRLKARVIPQKGVKYHDLWSYHYEEGTMHVHHQSYMPQHIIANARGTDIFIGVGESLSFDSPDTTVSVGRAAIKMASRIAGKVLIEHARSTSRRLGISNIRWEIGRGTRTLGSCYHAERRIKLSAICIFLPVELREYIICHELAHLTHADHSPAFHSLTNTYLQGHEQALHDRLKKWDWPIVR